MKAISHTEAETGSLAMVAIAATPLSRSLAGLVITNPIQGSEPAGADARVLAMLAPSVPWLFPGDRSWDSSPLAVRNRSEPCGRKVFRVSPLGRVTCAAAPPETEVRISDGPYHTRPQRCTVIRIKHCS